MNKLLFALSGIFSMLIMPCYAANTDIIYPQGPISNDTRAAYAKKVIQLALQKTQKDFGEATVRFSPDPMERPRQEKTVEWGKDAHILMLPGNSTYDERFLLVPIPIDKGLVGYRVSLIHQSKRNQFNAVKTIDDLKPFKACLARSWRITQTFEYNKLNVQKVDTFSALFKRVQNNRCDYFSRGVGEILDEYGHWSKTHNNIAIESNLLLRTQMAFYLYVTRTRPELAKRIKTGLNRALEDGSFEDLFLSEFQFDIEALNLQRRTLINLESRTFHKNAPLEKEALWYHP